MCSTCRSIDFIQHRDGAAAARAFAQQAVRTYRSAVLHTPGLVARRQMVEAYLCAKAYIRKEGSNS